jgi:3-oxoacyl-[acyl-carrier-protein] synthase-3
MSDAYINATGAVLPGPPISNDEIEEVLGRLGNEASRLRGRILRNNGIQTRHYAIDRHTGAPTHTSAALAAEAVRVACARRGLPVTDVGLLACATSIPEQIVPGHASMVHGELGTHPCEIATLHGVCGAGVTALKYAAMAVQTGAATNAVACAVERTSAVLRSAAFTAELKARTAAEEEDPFIGFDQEFLRWMLSDGAGAVVVQDRPRPDGLSLRIEWIELVSFAHELPTCMYMGGAPTPAGGLVGWRDGTSVADALRGGQINLHQDVKLLAAHMVETCVRSLEIVRRRRDLTADAVDWLLPHYSSEFFREKTHDAFVRVEFPLPYERWCSNLVERGNTGCASPLVMLDDFLASGRLRAGQSVLLLVPESGRFSCAWVLLRAV